MRPCLKHNQKGFTLVELMITIVIFLLVIIAASNIFSSLLNQFKQQSKIAESNIEGIIGLEMLRSDIEQAGYGLPWDLNGAAYTEAGVVTDPWSTIWTDRQLNDGPPNNPVRGTDLGHPTSNPPGAIRALSGEALNGSDVLCIKATNIATNDTVKKWTYVLNTGANSVYQTAFNVADEDLLNNDRIIVIRPVLGTRERVLLRDSTGQFYANFNSNLATFGGTGNNADFLPFANTFLAHIFYGISPSTANPRMPFNRADYYVRQPATGMPTQCAPGSGILYKAVLSNNDTVNDTSTPPGSPTLTELPLLDCVADMQVVFALDANGDGTTDNWGDTNATLTAANIRDQLKEVRVYILAHEGQRDNAYTSAATITATDPNVGAVINYDAATAGTRNYRWKIYTMVVTPYNLR